MRHISVCLALVVLFAAELTTAEDQSVPDGTIYGHVYDAGTRKPISQAWVYCQQANCPKQATDQDGYYAIESCFSPSRSYVIECTKNGYPSIKNTAETNPVGNAEVDFSLVNTPIESPKPDLNPTQLSGSLKSIVSPDRDHAETGRSSKVFPMLAPISDASNYDVLLDVSEGASEYAEGAVHISYSDFIAGNSLKPVPELASILGEAGISEDDSVLIYGECVPCGGGPSVATYVYWILKYLGHDKVSLMDGSIKDWEAAGLFIVNQPSIRPETSYLLTPRNNLLATFEYVTSGEPQIVDARSTQDFRQGSITGAINIPYNTVVSEDGKIKDETALKDIYDGLSNSGPVVVVYGNSGIGASLIWFTLEMQGYDARSYSFQDWQEHLSLLAAKK